jgi:2-keto-4-pentenoate hydratase
LKEWGLAMNDTRLSGAPWSDPAQVSRLRDAIDSARRLAQIAEVSSLLSEDLSEAYRIGLETLSAKTVAAWKLGGANPWSQSVFHNEVPFFGALLPHEVTIGRAELSLAGLVSPFAEPEVMLEIAELPAAGRQAPFSRMAIGVEIPASVLDAVSRGTLFGQIADRAGAGALWIAPPRDFDADWLEDLTVQFCKRGAPALTGHAHSVIGGPVGAAAAMVDLARELGAPLRAGQWIACGGMVPAVPVCPGDVLMLSSRFGEMTLTLCD